MKDKRHLVKNRKRRERRRHRLRKVVSGTSERPRMVVHRSLRHIEVQLVDEWVFQSNYNQMFLLGRYDGELFEETYNAFPFSRLFRVKF